MTKTAIRKNCYIMQYDVFISSKSEDYYLAEEVYNFLTKNGLSVFIASEELQKIGEAQYANAIDEALDESVHMVVVASSLSHIKSKWVKYEWGIFSNDIKSGYREGNLLTILSSDVELKTLPASLRHQQSFHFDNYKKLILDFLKVPQKENKFNLDQQQINTPTSVAIFKIYSNENCKIILDGKVVGTVEGMADEPVSIKMSHKGDYRFKAVNLITEESKIIKEHIDINEEKVIEIEWGTTIIANKSCPQIKEFNVFGNIFNMISVEPGRFYMGGLQKDIPNAHEVVLTKGYYIGETLVTQRLWHAIMKNNPSRFINESNPVDSVSWNDCQSFIDRLNKITGASFRLPYEAEWEFAARGGIYSKEYKYSGSDNIDDVAWYDGNSKDQTHPIKQKNPNELGIYDMSGNVWEWCQDYYDVYDKAVAYDPSGPFFGVKRVYRGGCWCEKDNCRITARKADVSDFSSFGGLGLRLALSL